MSTLVVTFFLGFLTGWSEFALPWQYLTDPKDFTLAMALWNLTGPYSGNMPWSVFAAKLWVIAASVAIIYLMPQRYIVNGLAIGRVK